MSRKKIETNTEIVSGTFNDRPVWSLYKNSSQLDSRYHIITMGIAKTKLILDHIEHIREWFDSNKDK
jgi:hypothetical protein